MLSSTSDAFLLKRIHNGNFDAVNGLILKYDPLIKAIIRDEVKNSDAADDVYGDVRLAIVRRFRRKGVANINAVDKWIKQVVRSKCKDYWRKEKKRQNLLVTAQEQHAAALDQDACKELRYSEVFEVIDAMDPIYKDVVELWLEKWTSAEIGEKLGIPESTVKSRKRAIVRKVREHFGVSLPN